MGKFLITGRQGCGKTTVIRLLSRNGFTAYNTDDVNGATLLENKLTSEAIDWPEGPVDWTTYAWNWKRPAILELLSTNETVFLGGVVSNQKDFYELFDKVFVLIVSADNLRHRLSTHEHDSHHLPGVMERILTNHEDKQQAFVNDGCIPVDANRPTIEIAKDILDLA